ncbi:MAG: RsmB/NOP family class I SAM-dependent RNA methyltransferase [Lentisphaerae bacterium]|nr:RsmB/NOP family class I SAM-dependent RNA methyltransferase [Lentisphaerota bacterium]
MSKVKTTLLPHSPEAVLTAALPALAAIRKNQCSLDEYLDRCPLENILRRRLANLLFGYYRHAGKLTSSVQSCCRKAPAPELLDLLTAALAMAKLQDALPPESVVNIAVTAAGKHFNPARKGFVNAVLRKALIKFDQLSAPVLPPEIDRVWKKRFSAGVYQYLTELFIQKPANTLRLRSNYAMPQEAALTPLELELPWKFFRTDKLAEVISGDAFQQGAFYIQDPAPAKVCSLLEKFHQLLPGTVRFIDLCAAPGGKLIMNMELLQMLNHTVKATALDRSESRLKLVSENLQRCQLSARIISGDGAHTPQLQSEHFELVTCDVPCSNSGVFRRRPDALWRWRQADQPAITALQQDILQNAAALTAPGGLLLYSTCSLEPAENEEIIAAFLKNSRHFQLLHSQLFMPDNDCDGTFAALLQKFPEAAQ